MALTEKEIGLVNEVKLLWKNNVENKFIEGYTGVFNLFKPLWNDGTFIQVGNNVCPFCREYLKKDGNCSKCLFVTKLGKLCINAGGREFCRNPSQETYINFIESINKILEF